MHHSIYIMESDEETLRLDLKTDGKTVENQALWAGIKPGMRVADLGFGTGKTTCYLHKLVQPNGNVIGVDITEDIIKYAKKHYNENGIDKAYQLNTLACNSLIKFNICPIDMANTQARQRIGDYLCRRTFFFIRW